MQQVEVHDVVTDSRRISCMYPRFWCFPRELAHRKCFSSRFFFSTAIIIEHCNVQVEHQEAAEGLEEKTVMLCIYTLN